jgi:hypothetical protein
MAVGLCWPPLFGEPANLMELDSDNGRKFNTLAFGSL